MLHIFSFLSSSKMGTQFHYITDQMNTIATNWKYVMLQWSRSIVRRDHMARLIVQVRHPLSELSCIGDCGREKYIMYIIWQQYKRLLPHHASLLIAHVMNFVEDYPTNLAHHLYNLYTHKYMILYIFFFLYEDALLPLYQPLIIFCD